ncbi:MAG: FtsK/SpoIIIE domain-containing protein, partial [Eubacteriales bacterium]|nr:FtsK/SpoIIIE domain-containing protein [Eubacteriales bacterium]
DEKNVSNAEDWEFVKWLPHVWSVDKKIRYFARNKSEAGEIFYAISQELQRRSDEESTSRRPYFILFVLSKELLDGEIITKYIDKNSHEIGFSTIIAADRYVQLPNRCEFIVENNESFAGMYSTIDENLAQLSILFDYSEQADAVQFAKRLANIETDETEGGGEIPAGISFFDLYGILRPEELHSEERWRMAKTSETMKGLVGVVGGGKPCYLDIHERYHGPHGLVAGTTGSGKSETLQTYMLSMAINYSPEDVGFFIIDYKGGGMANLFTELPHTIGSISNLSGNQVKRAMISIKSENKRRQRIFSAYGVNNINSYTALYKNGDATEPLPHMLIIVDEFAELKREEPDFMKELISVAQVGRSLGVHLILSTQKPSGTVDENIWSNSKFKLCLRVQDKQDSMDMLHRPDAAYLTQAGRCYLQVGNDEIFEQFQSGYSGAPYEEASGSSKLVIVQILDSVGKVDLVGNHLKIKHQQETQERWITILQKAFADQTYETKEKNVEVVFDNTSLRRVYQSLQQ